ncbi:MAG: gliding motility-associated C-terminal domain-containing protein [Bacteroidetes bacterium]|nr:gliding motility-associated C-terminal domain-containing protein [Bacteroidota bacterium]
MRSIKTLVILIFVSFTAAAQTDNEFWFVAPEVTNTHTDKPIFLRLSAENVAATVTISQPATNIGFWGQPTIVKQIPANTSVSVDLTNWLWQIESGEPAANVIENKGLLIQSTANITAYYEVLGTTNGVVKNSDIFVLKGRNALGKKFYTPFQNLSENADNISWAAGIVGNSSFDIVATEDGTTVTINPTKDIVGHTAGIPFTITLNKGQTYSGRATGRTGPDHLSGTVISSNKPIAVTIKDDSVKQNWALDLIGDQLVPVNIVGTDYIALKGSLINTHDFSLYGDSLYQADFGDRIIVTATEDLTDVTINGVLITTLSEGQTYNYQLNTPAEYIQTSKPAYVFHVSGFGNEKGGALLPPIVCTGSNQVSFFRDTEEHFFLNILVKSGNEGNFSLKNSTTGVTTNIASNLFSYVPNTPVANSWMQARIEYNTATIPSGSTNLISNSTSNFHLGIINGEAVNAGARYGYFSAYARAQGGTVPSTQICTNNSVILNASGTIGAIEWQESVDGTNNWTTVTGGQNANTPSYTTEVLTQSKYFRTKAVDGTCASDVSTAALVTVFPTTVAGTLLGDTTICTGINSGTLTLSGNVGSVVRWESSTNNFATTTTINNITSTLNYTNLNTTTKYRVVVQSGVCAAATSAVATVTVSPVTVGGTVGGSATVCSGSNAGNLTIAGKTGNIIKWQSSTDNFATVTDINSTLSTIPYSNISVATKYRAVVQSGACAVANSAFALISIDAPTVGGTVNGSAVVCSGANSGTLTLAGNTGTILNWESSIDDFATVITISNTSSSLNYTNVSKDTKYRAIVKSGQCGSAPSASALLTINTPSAGGSTAGATTVCATSNSGTITLSGETGNVIRWEKSTNNFTTSTTIANTSNTLNFSNISVTTSYRAVVQSGVCASANSLPTIITVNPTSIGGTINGSKTVCSSGNSGTLTLVGKTGTVDHWESSTDNFATFTIIANTTTTLSFTNLLTNTKYRAVVKSGLCQSANSAEATITVDNITDAGSAITDTSVCISGNSGTIQLVNQTGTVLKWESSTNNFVGVTTIANTTTSINFSNLTVTTKYRATVQSGTCASSTSVPVTISVDPLSVGGTATGATTVCPGINSGTVSLAGALGIIDHWESSISNFVNAQDITTHANTNDSISYLNLANTTYYRAVVKSGSCATANSASVKITMDVVPVGGTASGTAQVCSGTNTGTITLSGSTGTIVNWESSEDNFNTVTTIANTTTTLSFLNLTKNTKYRAVVKSSTCSALNSVEAFVLVDSLSNGGTLLKDTAVCFGTNTGTLSLTNKTGSILNWESSEDNFVTKQTIASTDAQIVFSNLQKTTAYRAIVKSGTCASANSNLVTVQVDPLSDGGSFLKDRTVCSGINQGSFTLQGKIGTIVNWESSTDGFATSTPIASTSKIVSYKNLTKTTQYRANVKSGTCAMAQSKLATVTVDSISKSGFISADMHVCSGNNVGTLELKNYVGNNIKWESSTNNFATVIANSSDTLPNYTFTNLSATTQYRVIVKSGVCGADTNAVVTVTADSVSAGGKVNGSTNVCESANSGEVKLTGNIGNVIYWESSTNNFNNITSLISNGTVLPYSNLTKTTKFRAVVKSGTCASDKSAAAEIVVDPISVGGQTLGAKAVCALSNSGILNLSGTTGAVDHWESSNDGFATLTIISDTSSTLQFTNLLINTSYRAVIKSGACASANASSAEILVDPVSAGGVFDQQKAQCYGKNQLVINLKSSVGQVIKWESSTDNFKTIDIPEAHGKVITFQDITKNTRFRAITKSGVCPADTSDTGIIPVFAPYNFSLGADTTLCFDGNKHWKYTLADTFASVLWSNGTTSSSVEYAMPGEVTVTVTNKNLCEAEAKIQLTNYCKPSDICFPDVITPNNDGINDNFEPCIDDLPNNDSTLNEIKNNIKFLNFEVYNRWGMLLFSSEKNELPKWDGMFNGNKVPDGTYYYTVKYRDTAKVIYSQGGYMTVIGNGSD